MLLSDQVEQSVRGDLRLLELQRFNFEIARLTAGLGGPAAGRRPGSRFCRARTRRRDVQHARHPERPECASERRGMPWRAGTLAMSSCASNCCSTSKHSDSTPADIRSMSADLSPPATSPATGVPSPVRRCPPCRPAVLPPPPTDDLQLGSPVPANSSAGPSALVAARRARGRRCVAAVAMLRPPKAAGADLSDRPGRPRRHAGDRHRDAANWTASSRSSSGAKSKAKEIKLVHIVPEGTHVTKGDEVGRFDTDELKQAVRPAESQVEDGRGQGRSAPRATWRCSGTRRRARSTRRELALELAKIDLEKYKKREYQVELDKRQGELGAGQEGAEGGRGQPGVHSQPGEEGLRAPRAGARPGTGGRERAGSR